MTVPPPPQFVGDDPDRPARPLPDLPAGWGAIQVVYWFVSNVDTVDAKGKPMWQMMNYDRWIPAPVATLDHHSVPAGWSGWWYPLPAGPHELAVTGPGPATLRVDVRAGVRTLVVYRADISFRPRPGGGEDEVSTATLTAGDPVPG